MTSTRTRWVLVAAMLLSLVVGVVLLTGNRNGTAQHDTPPPMATPVEVAPVTVGRVTESVGAVGTLQANESVMIRPELAGLITKVHFQEGRAVEQGKVLIEMDEAELRAQLAQATAALEIARLNHERTRRLIANDNVSQQELDQAATTLKSAEATHALYQARLSKTKIRAPFSGYLGVRRISPGDYVQAGTDIVNLEDITTLKLDFNIPEMFFSRLAVGQPVEVRVDALPGNTFEGRVYMIDPRADDVSRTISMRARIPNLQAMLRPGMFATVRLVLGQTDGALLIPEEAVTLQQEQAFVFRVVDKTARWTEVKLGAREKGMVQVLEGLQASDIVVRAGLQKIRDGASVKPLEST